MIAEAKCRLCSEKNVYERRFRSHKKIHTMKVLEITLEKEVRISIKLVVNEEAPRPNPIPIVEDISNKKRPDGIFRTSLKDVSAFLDYEERCLLL